MKEWKLHIVYQFKYSTIYYFFSKYCLVFLILLLHRLRYLKTHGSLIRFFQVPTHNLHHVSLIIPLIEPEIMDKIIVLVSSDTVVNNFNP